MCGERTYRLVQPQAQPSGQNTPNAVVLVEWDVEFREHQVFSQPTAIPLNPHLYLSENAHNGWNMVHSGYGQFMQQQANTP